MAYTWLLIDRAFFVRWKKLEGASLDKILFDVTNARKAVSQPILYTAIVPEDLPVPSAADRAALNDFVEKLQDHCEVSYMVMEGDSIKHSIQRTALTGIMFLVQRGHRMKTEIHKRFSEVLNQVAPKVGRQPAELERLLRARGFLVDPLPGATGGAR